MPKQRITKEMVVEAAFEIARKEGIERATVKAIAERLGCSVQPIYSYCRNMDGLRADAAQRARQFVREYVAERADKTDLFRSMGHTYVRLAREEPHIFRLYLFEERKDIISLEELYRSETDPRVAMEISEKLGVSIEEAKGLHMNMLIYTIGVGTIFSVISPSVSEEEIFEKQEEAYKAFLKSAAEGKNNG